MKEVDKVLATQGLKLLADIITGFKNDVCTSGYPLGWFGEESGIHIYVDLLQWMKKFSRKLQQKL